MNTVDPEVAKNYFHLTNIDTIPGICYFGFTSHGASGSANLPQTYEWAIDNLDNWTLYKPSDSLNTSPTLQPGQTVYWRGKEYPTTGTGVNDKAACFFVESIQSILSTHHLSCHVDGSVMSLVDYGTGTKEITQEYGFMQLFFTNGYNPNQIMVIGENLLPATKLAKGCYNAMFNNGVGAVKSIPEKLLPATELADGCYASMFWNGFGGTTLPKNLLPADYAISSCYTQMFFGSKNLESVPTGFLPATKLGYYCYQAMFRNCPRLKTLEKNFIPKDFECILDKEKVYYTQSCCEMFYACSALEKVNFPLTDWKKENKVFTNWLFGVAPEGDFYCSDQLEKIYGASNIPNGWKAKPFKSGASIIIKGKRIGGR